MAVIDLLMIGLGIDTRRLRDGERALGRLQQAGNKAENAMGRMASMLASAFAVSKIIEYADAYTNLQNRLKLVTDSTEALAQATQNVIDIAQNSRQALGATGDLYFKISQNADKLGLSVADVSQVTETFGKTLALSGAGTQQAEAAILQFSQALASGVFRGDEFNSVAENAPAAMDAFSRALGVTKGELRKLAHDGALTADVLDSGIKRAIGGSR
ncbi:MAG: tape measure protein [Chitinophagaceae bacterium]|nr:tape measure protein [Chitinophagaceae bacterium]